jgi:prepilin-type N-terminal cleavage/methylation domain-containing protein
MKTNTTLPKNLKHGFTLIEVIAVLVLLGILAAIAVPKYIDMTESAKTRAIDAGIAEMNGRELLTWGNAMLATGGWSGDALPSTALNAANVADSAGYSWGATAPTLLLGNLSFQGGTAVALTRTPGDATKAATWSRTP